MNPSLAEYHVPVHLDVPTIELMWTDIPDPYAPVGARGIGEIGITGVAAAVANAVYNATGIRVRDLPITPDKLIVPLETDRDRPPLAGYPREPMGRRDEAASAPEPIAADRGPAPNPRQDG